MKAKGERLGESEQNADFTNQADFHGVYFF